MRLSPEQARVIGCLVEKQLTTPQQYPLTLNALVLGCNQSSNRDPIVSYDEALVQRTLASLKAEGLVRFVYPSSGRSVTRYHQLIDEVLRLSREELALLAVLALRGPQTVGELRTRSERMAAFPDLEAVRATLEQLAGRETPLAEQLARRPGQKEERWVELLTRAKGETRPEEAGDHGPAPGPQLKERTGPVRSHRYEVSVHWTGDEGSGTSDYRSYSRDHEVGSPGKAPIAASSEVSFRGDGTRWNPEELFVASLSQCHMLWYLHLASAAGVVVTEYRDDPVGTMDEYADGSGRFTAVVLRPQVTVADGDMLANAHDLHDEAHRLCFIASSVNFPVRHEPSEHLAER